MNKTFGEIKPYQEGLLAPVHFVELGTMNKRTSDGRMLFEDGGDVRELPRTGYVATTNSGHAGAEALMRIDMIEFKDGVISGHGWLVDDPAGRGRLAYQLIDTMVLRHNSLDLADVEYEYRWNEATERIEIDFTQWAVAATTILGVEAMSGAHVEVGEIVASFDPSKFEPRRDDAGELAVLEVHPQQTSVRMPSESHEMAEQVASLAAAKTIPAEPFFRPEADRETALTIDENGNFWGHLGVWTKKHAAFQGAPRYINRSRNNYAGILKPGPLVEWEDGRRGQIEVAPIFLYNGHAEGMQGKDQEAINEAYGSVENAWGHYRIHDGRFGPWICGSVKPHATEEQIYDARCSPISGHWLDGELKAIVSVNVNAYEVEGSGEVRYMERVNDDQQLELVASFAPPRDIDGVLDGSEQQQPTDIAELVDAEVSRRLAEVRDELAAQIRDELEGANDPAEPSAVQALRERLLA